ncbi:MAG: CydX/CbdX family cytochrome bd oxidase small subunit [Reyranella sp.]
MFVRYIIAMALAALAILFGIILGDYGPWYLSWFLGTGFMVLVAVSAGVLFEAQEDAAKAARGSGESLDVSSAVDAPAPAQRPSR